ncbi:hypothetical protein ACMZ6Y_00360 [Streptococcus pluranimalium]
MNKQENIEKFTLYVLENHKGIIPGKLFDCMVGSMEKLGWDSSRYDDVMNFWLSGLPYEKMVRRRNRISNLLPK